MTARRSSDSKPAGRARADGDRPRTRGGWTPVGTAATRREEVAERSTAKGQAARRRLIDAARRVFERDGFVDVSVDDIVREADVARGSFYTYFTSKLDIFRVISHEVSEAMDAALVPRPDDPPSDPVAALSRSNLRYMAAYRDNARMYALAEQMAHADDESLDRLRQRRKLDVERVTDRIRRWQQRGVADPDVDPIGTAAALVTMTRHLCYWVYVVKDDAYDEATAAAAINDVWIRSTGLHRRPQRRWLDSRDRDA